LCDFGPGSSYKKRIKGPLKGYGNDYRKTLLQNAAPAFMKPRSIVAVSSKKNLMEGVTY
jgi:hypothetical protein